MKLNESNFIKACYGKNDSTIPVWVMRQAGRYLPEYRKVREKVSFLELCRSPKLIAEVVRQPVERFGFDAAILFSDILIILEPMGMKVTFPEGGPRLEGRIETPEDVERLTDYDVREALPFVPDGIREIKKALPDTPLIGFAGSPFTLACYLIEGQGSKTFNSARQFIYRYPRTAEKLLSLITSVTAEYLKAQAETGVDAVQIFDSWGGLLARDDYGRWSLEYINKIFGQIEKFHIPRILYLNNTAPFTEHLKKAECDVIGADYRTNLAELARILPDKAVQGNLDPAVLFATPETVREKAKRILDSLDNHDNLIFNLGHGILPKTPVESVEALVATVHQYR